MKKLWQKNKTKMNKLVEIFETKEDLLLDQKLLPYDIQGSLAHAKMLKKIAILSEKEYQLLEKGLMEIMKLDKKNKFQLVLGDEDIHTKIENYLTKNYGEIGKKIHTARSRNDQVLTALRLYSKKKLMDIEIEALQLKKTFNTFNKKYKNVAIPGYTHMQKAMPSSIGMWIESFIDMLDDDIKQLQNVYMLIDQSPLGSAAGYGLPIKIDRTYTAKLLYFSKVQKNPIYCQNSRGKFDIALLATLLQVQMTINKFVSDVLLFTTTEFNFLEVDASLCSGSSIMPQKKNVDIAELLRSKVHIVLGNFTQVVSRSTNLISGYNRDMQDNKKALIDSFDITRESLLITTLLVKNMQPNQKVLKEGMTDELYATEKALNLTLQGKPFRDAYNDVAKNLNKRVR